MSTTEQRLIERYNTLAAIHKIPEACFVCGKVRRTVNALVDGPRTDGRSGVGGRCHGVCLPCIKAHEAVRIA